MLFKPFRSCKWARSVTMQAQWRLRPDRIWYWFWKKCSEPGRMTLWFVLRLLHAFEWVSQVPLISDCQQIAHTCQIRPECIYEVLLPNSAPVSLKEDEMVDLGAHETIGFKVFYAFVITKLLIVTFKGLRTQRQSQTHKKQSMESLWLCFTVFRNHGHSIKNFLLSFASPFTLTVPSNGEPTVNWFHGFLVVTVW